MGRNDLIGNMLVSSGIITEEQLKEALEEQKKTGERLLDILKRLGSIDEETLAKIIAKQWGYPYIDLSTVEIDKETVHLISEEIARRFEVIPFGRTEEGEIMVAISDPTNIFAIDFLRNYLNNVKIYVASKESIIGLSLIHI